MSTAPSSLATRRQFMRRVSLSSAGGSLAMLGSRAPVVESTAHRTAPVVRSERPRPQTPKFSPEMRDGLAPKRVTNAMWDYSWLAQHYPGGAFANFDKAAAELAERNLNTVWSDAFLCKGNSTTTLETTE